MISFTLQDFLEMITAYNSSFWPLAVISYVMAATAILLVFFKFRCSNRIVVGLLVLYWLWVGIVFNGILFSKLMPAAIGFSFLFVIQAALMFKVGLLDGKLTFKFEPNVYGYAGILAVLFALIGYPMIALITGRGFSSALMIGLTPCPTTVFTLGLFFWAKRPMSKILLPIPVLYAFSGWIPASLGIVEDYGLILTGLAVVYMVLIFDKGTSVRKNYQY